MASLDELTVEQIAEIDRLLDDKVPSALVKAYAKDISDKSVVLVLSDWLLERGIEPQPVIERMKLLNEQRIRRDNMREVTREELEDEPLRIQALTLDPDPIYTKVRLRHRGQSWRFEVVLNRGAGSHQVVDAEVKGVEETLAQPWGNGWERFERQSGSVMTLEEELEGLGFDTQEIIEDAEKKHQPWIGFDGEMLYPQGDSSNEWLWMGYPPEHMQRQLEKRYPDSDFITLYTDGGGFQSAADPAFVVDDKQLYQLVYDSAHGAEVECPFMHWNHEHREDERDRVVTDDDTLWGEYPHKNCRFCEADIGEAHGYVYVGEGGEYTYALVPEEDEDEDDGAA
jgi:hypothetical protein